MLRHAVPSQLSHCNALDLYSIKMEVMHYITVWCALSFGTNSYQTWMNFPKFHKSICSTFLLYLAMLMMTTKVWRWVGWCFWCQCESVAAMITKVWSLVGCGASPMPWVASRAPVQPQQSRSSHVSELTCLGAHISRSSYIAELTYHHIGELA